MKISNEANLLLQLSSLLCAILFNSLLIYLILTKSPKKMGTYKALMIYFSAFSMVFAIIDIIVRPVSDKKKSVEGEENVSVHPQLRDLFLHDHESQGLAVFTGMRTDFFE